MKPRRARRCWPLYPALIAVGALAAGCGPEVAPAQSNQAMQGPPTTQPDAGPLPSDFIGGDRAFEVLPDGGTP